MTKVIILGAGQIGRAAYNLTVNLQKCLVECWDKVQTDDFVRVFDIENITAQDLIDAEATHIINALPFYLNEKIAIAAAIAGCHYIDFTEDDVMADKVQNIYRNYPKLSCAVKCGLAPGFINYVGHNLAKKFDTIEKLMISVGALPRNVNWIPGEAWNNYNLSWSIDGLVNEYIRPCRVKLDGEEEEIPALSHIETVYCDGVVYEAAFTSGGIGSLIKELPNAQNVFYKTLRYPGHYHWVINVVSSLDREFDKIKEVFTAAFPVNTTDDVIAVYAEAKGYKNGVYRRETFARHFVGAEGLSAIQSTTAGGGVSILTLMLEGKLKGIINHADVSFDDFMNTNTFKNTYIKIR
jgi:saccharopine dehydrogenase-like NADP-dependent oxidoreductase